MEQPDSSSWKHHDGSLFASGMGGSGNTAGVFDGKVATIGAILPNPRDVSKKGHGPEQEGMNISYVGIGLAGTVVSFLQNSNVW